MKDLTTFFGPPGCGKTTQLMTELGGLVAGGVPVENIVYTSFTRAAIDVAKSRVREVVDVDDDALEGFGTLHAICGRLTGFDWKRRLLSETTRQGQDLYRQFGRTEGFTFDFTGDVDMEADGGTGIAAEGNQLLAWYGWARQSCLDTDDAIDRWRVTTTSTLTPARQKRFVECYTSFKRDLGLADFTDVLVQADHTGADPRAEVLILDEAQDLSPLQWRIIDRWRENATRTFFGGDDDQAIYSFQGSDASLFLDRTRDGAVVTLDQSRRLPRASWQVATWLSSLIRTRQDKPFRPMDADGLALERMLYGLPIEDDGSTWFILARNTYLLAGARAQLERRGIPYTSRRGFDPVRVYYPAARAITELARGRAIARDDLAMLVRYLDDGDVDPYLTRRLQAARLRELPRTITQHNLEDLGFTERFRNRLSREQTPVSMLSIRSARGRPLAATWNYLVRLQRDYGDDVFSRTPRVQLSTIHGVKGDEADNVALLSDCSPATHRTLDLDPDSEHRVWYVGVSRARKNLYVLAPTTDTAYPWFAGGQWRLALAGSRG